MNARWMLSGTMVWITALAACGSTDGGGSQNGTDVKFAPSVSECGGFLATRSLPPADAASYCDAEVLAWTYDSSAAVLGLVDRRVQLNCCGDHSLAVTRDGDTYVITERDAPEATSGGGRCGCECVFDYAVEVSDVPPGPVDLRVERLVTDTAAGTEVVYSGEIDLSDGSGSIVLDATSAEPWCSGEAT